MAHGLRELPIHQALALLPVARVDTGRAHRDPDLAGLRMRIGEIDDLEDLRAPNWLKRTAFMIRSDDDSGCLVCSAHDSLPARVPWMPGYDRALCPMTVFQVRLRSLMLSS